MQLVSKISNLCGPDPSTSQTDKQTDRGTDDMQSQYRACTIVHCALRGKKQEMTYAITPHAQIID